MRLKIALLEKAATYPQQATEGSSGYDLYALGGEVVHPGSTTPVRTGIAIELEYGYEAQIRSRSGLAKLRVTVANSPGTIDSDYRGEIVILLRNDSPNAMVITRHMRVAQMVFARVEHPDEIELCDPKDLGHTDRGPNGCGSTGGF